MVKGICADPKPKKKKEKYFYKESIGENAD